MNKKMKRIIIFTLIFLLIFGVGICLLKPFFKKEATEEEKKEKVIKQYTNINSTSLQDEVILEYQRYFNNPDIIGELSIPNTNLKVPVLHTSDNEYYLNHLVDKTYNTLGSIFLDYRNRENDRKIIIYGHNSENVYTEFNVLENYLNRDYYNEHQDIYFKTLDDNYHYKIFSVYVAIADYRYINLNFSDSEYNEHLRYLKNQSAYDTLVDVFDNDEIIVLQTCYFHPKGSYIIVVGRKVN